MLLPSPAITFRSLLALGAAIMLALASSAGSAAAQDRSLEYAVKATYLYKFVPFIAWPIGAFAAPTSPFDICIVGENNFANLVANGIAGQSAEGHSLAVRRVTKIAEENECQVLFVSGEDKAVLAAARLAVRGKPVLTVTDAAPDGEHGVVNFVLRVRFEIDLGQAARNGIAISSKLLSLAVAVQPSSAARSP